MAAYIEYDRFLETAPGWRFNECIYRPAKIQGGHKHAPWEELRRIRENDEIVHIRDINGEPCIIGSSFAAARIQILPAGPPGEICRYGAYRIPLRGFVRIPEPVPVRKVLLDNRAALIEYLKKNRKMLIFDLVRNEPVLLSNVDFSILDDELQQILFFREQLDDVATDERLVESSARIGQAIFANRVKENYKNACAFPGCSVNEKNLLIAAHIARWADAAALRGRMDNGIAFCRNHDGAFERGMFTIDRSLRICVRKDREDFSSWFKENLLPAEGKKLNAAQVKPSLEACQYHWKRHGYFGLH
jgi:hypothetical protein